MNKISENRLVSLGISGIISWIMGLEILFLFDYLQVCQSNITLKLIHGIVWLICLGLFYFLQKKIYQSKKNRLVKYFFFSLSIAVAAVFGVLFLLSRVVTIPAIVRYMQMNINNQNGLVVYVFANVIFFLMFTVFITVFAIAIKSKVNYVQYISNSVKKMEHEGFGLILEVKYDDELSELGKSINNMSIALYEKQEREKREEESKNRMIADISHDLRTPLTSVVGYLNLLKEDGFEHKELCTQYTEVIDRRVEHMTEMINQLFEYTRLIQTDTPIRLKKTDLTRTIHYIDHEYRYLLKKTDKKWKVQCPDHSIYINMDEEKIIRALGNLLENARKYSSSDSEIILNVEEKKDTVIIEVSNKTDLIQEDNLQNIFERFYRTDLSRTENEKNGTGLGLPIVKRIIELHAGDIHVKLVNQTIIFIIELPKE